MKRPLAKAKRPRAGPGRKAAPRRIAKNALGPYALEVLSRLKREYPDARTELDYETPLQLLIATILSAQCTDKRVNMVTPLLFQTFPTAAALADAPPEKLEEIIRSTGFFRNKTKSLIGLGKALVERHNGEVPDSMDALVKLPGVGRKTANVVLGQRVREERRRRRRHPRCAAEPPPRPHQGDGSGQDRAGSDAAIPARRLGAARAPADLSRPASLRRQNAQVRNLRAQ